MNPINHDLESLFNRLADGVASEADKNQLSEVLRSSPEARLAYRQFMALHSALHWDYVATAAPDPPMPPLPPDSTTAPRVGWLVAFAAGTIVATVVVIAVLTSFTQTTTEKPAISAENGRGGVQSDDDSAQAESIAALLVDEVGAVFAEGQAPDGVRFGPGEYELLKGNVHLRFARGADVVVAGPARFHVQDPQRIRLDRGKVRVTAPPTAKGFTVATLNADYVDLGTEFGLRVDPHSGASDLYVFDGQVNVEDPRSGKVLSAVVEGESSRLVDGAIGNAPQLQDNDFPTAGAIGLERWQQYERQIREDPGLLAFFPFRKAADESVLANGLSKDAMADGRIMGARWTTGRWQGKDALLFDRNSDYVEIDIPGEHAELTIAVWLKVDRLDFGLNVILNSNGYDLGDIHFQLTRQGYPRGGVVIEGNFDDKVIGNTVPLGQWTHVVSVLSTRTRFQQIFINGALARERRWPKHEVLRPGSCRLGNWLPVANGSPEIRALRGRVDELAIWTRALAQDEIRRLVESGRPELLGTSGKDR